MSAPKKIDVLAPLFHIVAINQRSSLKVFCTDHPMTHDQACHLLAKFSSHPARRVQFEAVR